MGIQTNTDKEFILKNLGGSTDVGNKSDDDPAIHTECLRYERTVTPTNSMVFTAVLMI